MADPSQDGLSASEIIHSENLELKPGEPNKNMTEDKSEKNQASNPSSEENAEKDGASAVMMTMRWMFMQTSRSQARTK